MAGVGLRRRGIGRGDDLPLSADINVTSLVDVAFTLLVIFIITAPILQGGLEVNLPQADIRPLNSLEDYVVVSIRPDGSVHLEETPLTIEEFETSFAQLAEAGNIRELLIRGDAEAPYGIVYRVAAIAQGAGVNPRLMGEPRPAARGR